MRRSQRSPQVIRAYQTMEWSEIAILGVLTVVLALVIESAFVTGGTLASLTAGTPLVAGGLAFRRYSWEPLANRVSAAFVGAAFGVGLQVLVALMVTT